MNLHHFSRIGISFKQLVHHNNQFLNSTVKFKLQPFDYVLPNHGQLLSTLLNDRQSYVVVSGSRSSMTPHRVPASNQHQHLNHCSPKDEFQVKYREIAILQPSPVIQSCELHLVKFNRLPFSRHHNRPIRSRQRFSFQPFHHHKPRFIYVMCHPHPQGSFVPKSHKDYPKAQFD